MMYCFFVQVPDIVGDGGRWEGHGDPSEAWVGVGDVFQNDHFHHLEIIEYYEHQHCSSFSCFVINRVPVSV